MLRMPKKSLSYLECRDVFRNARTSMSWHTICIIRWVETSRIIWSENVINCAVAVVVLHVQIDMVTEREDRWSHDINVDIPRRKGILKQVHKFDNNFFGIHAKQTKVMDPQGRLLIECAYEAIVDSGINPHTLRGQNIGVFVANSFSESEKTFMYDAAGSETFNLTGYAPSTPLQTFLNR